MAIQVFYGITRKVVPAFVVLSFIGWVVFVASFAKQNDELQDFDPDYQPKQNFLYPYWAGCVLGPIVYILAVTHALLWGFPSAIVGSITAVLSMMYISAVSFILVGAGMIIRNKDFLVLGFYKDDTVNNLQFAGGFVAVFFWTFVLALWPWYKIAVDGQFAGL